MSKESYAVAGILAAFLVQAPAQAQWMPSWFASPQPPLGTAALSCR